MSTSLPTASYAVTGASGRLGRLAVDALLRRGVPAERVIALARDPSQADELTALGVGVRRCDYDEPRTVEDALQGVERLLLVSGPEVGRRREQHRVVIDAADAADVGYIVYTSVLHADESERVIASDHAETESMLQGSGIPYAAARNGWYLENYTARLEEYLREGEIVGAAGRGRIAVATRADYAEAAVSLLVADIIEEHGVHELGGPSVTMAELADTITEVTGTAVRYRDLTPDELAAELARGGTDDSTAELVLRIERAIARGELDTSSDALALLLGRAPTSPADAVRAARV